MFQLRGTTIIRRSVQIRQTDLEQCGATFPSVSRGSLLHWCVPYSERLIRALVAAGAACITLTPTASSAQEPAPASAVVEAAQLRDSSRFAEAIAVLRKHRELQPDDGDAIRMLAQTLYWIKDVRGARALYDSGLVLHPADTALRLQYARTLMETGSPSTAKEILAPLVGTSPSHPQATELLGTMAYWEGDLTSARRYFQQALTADTSLADARRQLDEIRSLGATWIRTVAFGSSDDQPVRGVGGEVESGYYIDPLWTVIARARAALLGGDGFTNPNSSSTDLTIFAGTVGLNGFVPSSRVNISVQGGVFNRSIPAKLDWTGKAELGAKVGSFVKVGVRAERAPYLYTEASLRTHVVTNTGGVALDIDGNGWLGQAAYDFQKFPDDNSGSTVYAWAMAPLVRTAGATLQAGYSASYQDTQQLRFARNAADPTGHYEPYYTPQNTLIHSAIGAFTASGANGFVTRLGASYGFHATEDAPVFGIAPGGSFFLDTFNRSFHPWTARASVEKTLASRSVLIARLDHAKTAFYHVTNAAVELTWRLAPR